MPPNGVQRLWDTMQRTGAGVVYGVYMLRHGTKAVSYTHLRAHETVLDLVCRLLLEKKNLHETTDDERHTNKLNT